MSYGDGKCCSPYVRRLTGLTPEWQGSGSFGPVRSPSRASGSSNFPQVSPVSVLVADRDRLFAECLAFVLSRDPEINVIDRHPRSGIDAVKMVESTHPDVVTLDYWLRGVKGAAVCALVAAREPATRVVVVSSFCGAREVSLAYGSGAAAFLPKTVPAAEIAATIHAVHRGRSSLSGRSTHSDEHDLVADPAIPAAATSLTLREIELLDVLGSGMRSEDAAAYLGIAPATVKTHLYAIFKKLDVTSQLEALALARRWELIEP